MYQRRIILHNERVEESERVVDCVWRETVAPRLGDVSAQSCLHGRWCALDEGEAQVAHRDLRLIK